MSQQITIPSAGDLLAEHYRIVSEIGRGAYGVVFKAEDLRTGQMLAIKTLLPQSVLDVSATERFGREAQMVSRLHHENLIELHDYGQQDGLFYMAVEFVEGRGLDDFLKQETPVAPERAFAIVKQILEALDHAHEIGIVHRDLKPANILLKAADPMANRPYETVKILDFGIAKLVRDDEASKTLTQNGHVLGTPHYMAPEQISGDEISHHADLYAVGIIMYELLTGKHPYKASSPTAVMIAHLHDDPDPLPPHLEQSKWGRALKLALAKQPFDRVESAAAFLSILEQEEAPQVHFPSSTQENEGDPTIVYARPSEEDLATQLYRLDEESLLDDDVTEDSFQDEAPTMLRQVAPNFGTQPSQQPHLAEEPITKRTVHPTLPNSAISSTPPFQQAQATSLSRLESVPKGAFDTAPTHAVQTQPESKRPGWLVPLILLLLLVSGGLVAALVLLGPESSDGKPQENNLATKPKNSATSTTATKNSAVALPSPTQTSTASGSITATSVVAVATTEVAATATSTSKPQTGVKPAKRVVKKVVKKRSSKPAKVTLKITSSPSKARVSVGGKPVGTTPMKHTVVRGSKGVSISVSLHGYEPMKRRASSSKDQTVNFALKKKRLKL